MFIAAEARKISQLRRSETLQDVQLLRSSGAFFCSAKSINISSRPGPSANAATQKIRGYCPSIAAMRKGPPLPPAVFIGIAMTKKPSAGSTLMSPTFSNAGTFFANRT